MKVTIHGLDVHVENLDELQGLIERFGDSDNSDQKPKKKAHAATNGDMEDQGNGGSVMHDRVILQSMVDAADSGVHTNTLGDMLGRKGKAVGPGLVQWAVKIGLVNDAANNPFEKARPNGGRGWKLKSTMQQIAKEMLEEMKK